MTKIKQYLKTNKFTKNLYQFLFYWKYEGLKKTLFRVIRKLSKDDSNNLADMNTRSYIIPDILRKNESVKKIEIVSCAFKKHEPKKGLTGGPNGVLATEKDIFGDFYRGMRMRYIFHSKNVNYPRHLEAALKGVSYMVKINFYAAYYLERCINIWERLNKDTDFLFVCHDIGFAYGAYLSKCPYILVYHTQGSLINERESFGEKLSDRDKELANEIEKIVFENAEEVYFPSKGAKESFIATTQIDTAKISFADKPLYNTIQNLPEALNIKKVTENLGIKQIDHEKTDVFLSVGDFSENKGMERIPIILQEYVKKTQRKVFWIAIGSKHKAGIFDKLVSEKNNWNFEAVLFGERINHDDLLALMEITDYYIMMQRHSIFDLSTLEAMRAGKGLILSAVGGNLEVNKENNVILVDMENITPAIEKLSQTSKTELGLLNKKVFENNFSNACFFKEYGQMLDKHMINMGIKFDGISEMNSFSMPEWKNKYKNKRVVICGSGSSLDDCIQEKDTFYIALNRALFYDKIKFDFLFMQDTPKNQPYTMNDYNKYPCTKFYGRITNIGTKNMGISESDLIPSSENVVRYELAPTWFDYRVDTLNFKLEKNYFVDAQSVLFSALQFAVYAGFHEIILYGIEFSETNYGNTKNPNNYNPAVVNNLFRFKKEICIQYPDVKFYFGSTANKQLEKDFDKCNLR